MTGQTVALMTPSRDDNGSLIAQAIDTTANDVTRLKVIRIGFVVCNPMWRAREDQIPWQETHEFGEMGDNSGHVEDHSMEG